jgi:hypothetical protein
MKKTDTISFAAGVGGVITMLILGIVGVIVSAIAGYNRGYTKGKEENCLMRLYQVAIDQDSIHFYQGDRKVSAIEWENTGKVDSVLAADNE